jgi:mannosyltransferase
MVNLDGKKQALLWLVPITLIAALTRLVDLGGQSLWYDEAFAWIVAASSVDVSWQAILADGNNPPLYYFILRLFLALGHSEFVIRLPTAFWGIAAVPAFYQVLRKWFDDRVTLFATFLLAISPFHVWFSREARMYSLVIFWNLCGLYCFRRLLATQGKGPWLWTGLIVCTGIAYNISFAAFFVTLAQLAFLVVALKSYYPLLRKWTVSQGLAFLIVLPWFVALQTRQHKSFGFRWIPQPDLSDVPKTLWNFAIGYTGELSLLNVCSLLPFLFVLVRSFWPGRRVTDKASLFVHIWFWVPLAFAWLISMKVSIYIDRFLIVLLPAFLALVSYGAFSLGNRWLRRILVVWLTLATLVGLGRIYFDRYNYTKEEWRDVARYIEQNEQPGDVIAPRFLESELALRYYYRGHLEFKPIAVGPEVRSIDEDIARGHERLWVIMPHEHDSRHLLARSSPLDLYNHEEDKSVRAWLEARRDSLVSVKSFSGLSVLLYKVRPGESP